jgi:hypothetical protein
MRRPLRLWCTLFLVGCGQSNQVACNNPVVTPQECDTLSRDTWRIGPYPTSSEEDIRVEIGGSRELFLTPFVDSDCAGSVASVTWSVEDASMAAVVPEEPAYSGSWVNGLAAGKTEVRARIQFSDGRVKTPTRAIQVVAAAAPAGSVIVAEGAVDLEPYNGNPAADYRRYVPFTIPEGSAQVDLTVNWDSPLDDLTVALFKGRCSGGASASCADELRFVASSNTSHVKPVTASVPNPPPGNYSARIDNLGPGPETARYEFRVKPD